MSDVNVIEMTDRGICTVCGNKAYHHLATKCDEHRGPIPDDVKRTPPAADVRIDRPTPVTDAPRKPASKPAGKVDERAQRALVLQRSILDDVNPQLPEAFAFICRPIPPENFYTLTTDGKVPTALSESILFTETEAKWLGRAAAELEHSQIGMMATAAVGPFLPIVYGIAGVGVLVIHTYKIMGLRAQLITQYQAQMQAEAQRTQPPVPDTATGEAVPADARGFGSMDTNGARPPDLSFDVA
jgi:hypothetical protein